MNDKDKEAFRLWAGEEEGESLLYDGAAFHTWQAACEYKEAEVKAYVNHLKDFDDEIGRLQAENKKLREALELTIKTAEYVYQPNKPLEKGLPPFHYHTLTYEGDLELIEKTIAARKLLDSTKE